MLTALIYAEIASMVPVSGSAYTYSYSVLGEVVAWTVGWALILEYAIAAGAVAVGWSGYVNGYLMVEGLESSRSRSPRVPATPSRCLIGTVARGGFNLFACLISLFVTWLLVIGTSRQREVHRGAGHRQDRRAHGLRGPGSSHGAVTPNFEPLLPNDWGTPLSAVGVLGAALRSSSPTSDFDAVSTAAEETRNPQKNIPIGLIASLVDLHGVLPGWCHTSSIGAMGAQPGWRVCRNPRNRSLSCMREIGLPNVGNWVAYAAVICARRRSSS